MQVFKFGGASVKDADGVKNVVEVLKQFPDQKISVVVSAMGKTTNALEQLAKAFFYNKENAEAILEEVKKYHLDICHQLFASPSHPVFTELENTFVELYWAIEDEPTHGYDFEYDQIVSMGEIISTKIISAYLNDIGLKNKWIDIRGLIQTDNSYRDGKVDFELTEALVKRDLEPVFNSVNIIVTQGFIGGTSENYTTTLGREGSDYTASILAYCLDAKNVTIWKDVPGVLNADPKWFSHTKKIDELSYHDAIELTYYGATVIHPKTIKPLQNKGIPLHVRCFLKPTLPGTIISDQPVHQLPPIIVLKNNQVLMQFSSKDFSFVEDTLVNKLHGLFVEIKMRPNLSQNAAISLYCCLDDRPEKIEKLALAASELFDVQVEKDVVLLTIRHYNEAVVEELTANKIELLSQKTKETIQVLLKNS